MSELQLHNESMLARTKSEKSTTMPKWVKWTVVISVWALLVFGSFGLAYYYIGNIQQQLVTIQQTNQANVQELNTKLESMQLGMSEQKEQAVALSGQFSMVENDLKLVKEELSLAGNTLSTSADTKQALSERITALSKELEELRKLIKKLEEAARAY
jgi:septal ring factor EnvC (AmiA/AmiB activator)